MLRLAARTVGVVLAPRSRALCASPVAATPAAFAASFSRRARAERLRRALDSARAGGEFVMPLPEPATLPGPCGAVMNVLRDTGMQTTNRLYELVQDRYPGVVPHKKHLKRRVLMDALRNKVIKVRATPEARFKDHWAVRRHGQIRAASSRRKRWGSPKRSRGPNHNKNLPALS